MNQYFLPKEFDKSLDYCSEYQYGENQTLPHWHSGAEIIYVNCGEVSIMFGDKWHTLTSDSLIFLPPHSLHCARCTDPEAEKTVIGFSDKILGKSRVGLSFPIAVNRYCVFHNLAGTEIAQLISRFHSCCCAGDETSEDRKSVV